MESIIEQLPDLKSFGLKYYLVFDNSKLYNEYDENILVSGV